MKNEEPVQRPLEHHVGRPAPELAKPLSRRQRELLTDAPDEWSYLPVGVGCTNATLTALEKRGLVETRLEPSMRLRSSWSGGWQWRKTPNAAVTRRAPGDSV